jgi:DNA-binding IclR family transcriptional regulator
VVLRGQTIAAVCLAMPLARVQVSPGADFGDAVVAAARRISGDLEQAAP